MGKRNSYSYIGISAILLIFGIIFVPKIIDRFDRGVVDDIRSDANRGRELVVHKEIPDFQFTNQYGKTITNADFDDRVHVVEFFFTTCPSICPVMNKNMQILDRAFGKNDDFGILSITIDPETDTQEVLKEYADQHDVQSKHWHFVRGDKETTYELSNKSFNLFAKENPDVNGGFEHSGMFALFDKQGRIRSRTDNQGNPILYYDGLSPLGIEMLKEDIQILLAE